MFLIKRRMDVVFMYCSIVPRYSIFEKKSRIKRIVEFVCELVMANVVFGG